MTKDGRYDLNFKNSPNDGKAVISGEQLGELYASFVKEFPLVSIEDPFDQDDWKHYAAFTAKLGDKVLLSFRFLLFFPMPKFA